MFESVSAVMNKNNFKCVLVDDDLDDIMIFELAFKKYFPSYELETFRSWEAFESAKISDLDFLFLDINMPLIDGFDVLKRIKTKKDFKARVLMFTTSNNPKDELESKKLGADGYIIKPSSITELNVLLKKFL